MDSPGILNLTSALVGCGTVTSTSGRDVEEGMAAGMAAGSVRAAIGSAQRVACTKLSRSCGHSDKCTDYFAVGRASSGRPMSHEDGNLGRARV